MPVVRVPNTVQYPACAAHWSLAPNSCYDSTVVKPMWRSLLLDACKVGANATRSRNCVELNMTWIPCNIVSHFTTARIKGDMATSSNFPRTVVIPHPDDGLSVKCRIWHECTHGPSAVPHAHIALIVPKGLGKLLIVWSVRCSVLPFTTGFSTISK